LSVVEVVEVGCVEVVEVVEIVEIVEIEVVFFLMVGGFSKFLGTYIKNI
jgi:hypothetical protein